MIKAEVLISELDRELANNEQGIAMGRSALARQLHIRPDAELEDGRRHSPSRPSRLRSSGSINWPWRRVPSFRAGWPRLLATKRRSSWRASGFTPTSPLGLTYMDMSKANAEAPNTASGSPNIGLFVGFNLPVYRNKYRAGVCEAEERAIADTKLYEAQRDEAFSEIQDLMVQARVQQNVLTLLRDSILPRTKESLELARSDYAKGNVDYATVLSTVREVLQVELQIVQVEAELGKALAVARAGCRVPDQRAPAHVRAD